MPTGNTGKLAFKSEFKSLTGCSVLIDTRYYWNLTNHIFRYTHHDLGSSNNPLGGGVHTVNERKSSHHNLPVPSAHFYTDIEIAAFVEMIRFYVTFILNMQESLAV